MGSSKLPDLSLILIRTLYINNFIQGPEIN